MTYESGQITSPNSDDDSRNEQEDLRRLNRSYRALSEAIRVRTSSSTEQELRDRIARLLKVHCGYRYVWVGYLENDHNKTVRPIAWSDDSAEFVQTLVVSWGEGPNSDGAVGNSIRAKKPILYDNVPQNPKFSPWKELAIKYEFHSAVSFPLFYNESVFGVLVIYSMSGDRFHREELTLLEEIAMELSTGVRILRDRIDREAEQAELRKLSKAVEHSPVSIVITGRTGIIEYVNPFFTKLTGYTAKEAIGKNPRILNSGKTPAEVISRMWSTILKGDSWFGEFINRDKFGKEFIEFARIAPILNDQQEITNFIAVKEDITQRKQLEEELKNMAHFDPLTSLPNRSLFNQRFPREVALAERLQSKCAIMFIDLDRFKQVNDQYGHEIGDALLVACAERMRQITRNMDTLARLGGDEFLMICNLMDSDQAVAGLAQKIVATVAQPFNLRGLDLDISASVGISLFPQHGHAQETLVKRADQAMYSAKKQGGNRFAFYRD